MINIKTIPVGQMSANCYVVWDETDEAMIIDPGDDADLIIQTIQRQDLKPSLIIATHGHFDHIMSVLELKLAFQIPFYAHNADKFLIDRVDKTAMHFIGFDPGPAPEIDFALKDNAEISVGKSSYKIIHTPGHTPGSVSIYNKKENIVFVGDVIFSGGYLGRTDFSYADKKELEKSVQKILSLNAKTRVYPGHDEATDVSSLSS